MSLPDILAEVLNVNNCKLQYRNNTCTEVIVLVGLSTTQTIACHSLPDLSFITRTFKEGQFAWSKDN